MNESKLIERELYIRDLRLTTEVLETRRSAVRWLALSLGLINPGESRLSAVYVLDSLLYFNFNKKTHPTVGDMKDYINDKWGSINEKTLRYHLLNFKNNSIIDHSKGKYYFVISDDDREFDESDWVNYYIDSQLEPIKDKMITVIKELKSR